MRISYLQFRPTFGEIAKNLSAICKLISGVKSDLIVLPELCTTGYLFARKSELSRLAERIPDGRTSRFFMELAVKNKTHIIAGVAEKCGRHLYNSAIITGPHGYIGRYRKIHLYSEEKLWFTTGNGGFKVFNIGNARVGVMICFDWIFPESARTLALKGADIVAHPANLVLPWCQAAMRTRSIENRVFTITANRTGTETRSGKSLSFTGKSQITGIKGEILAQSGASYNAVRTVVINPETARDKSLNRFNDLFRDRKPQITNSKCKI